MGYRMERYKQKKLKKKIRRKHRLTVILVVIVFVTSLNIVDQSFRDFLCIDDIKIFDYKYYKKNHNIQFLGQNFYISQESIDNSITSIKIEVTRLMRVIKEFANK